MRPRLHLLRGHLLPGLPEIMTPNDKPIETSLAAEIPPLSADHKAALEAYLATSARTITDADFEAMILLYRAQRRAEASARIARDRKQAEKAALKAAREAKRLTAKGGGEGTTV